MNKKIVFILFAVMMLEGCVSLPPLDFAPSNIAPTGAKINAGLKGIAISFGKKKELLGEIQLGFEEIQAGNSYEASFKSTFKDALQEAIIRSAIFNDAVNRKLFLVAKVLKLETPVAGINFNTSFIVRYQLLDTSSGKEFFTQDIPSTGQVPFSYAFMGTIRYIEARNRAVRENIVLFLDSLS